MKVAASKGSSPVKIDEQIGNLKLKANKKNESNDELIILIEFCFKHLGKSFKEVTTKDYGFFNVTF